MRRYIPLLIAGSAFIAAACREPVAPTRPGATELQRFGGNSFSALVNAGEDANAQTITFQILPEGGTASIGSFNLNYEANAVCDPATSGYGSLYWEQPCNTLNEPITITARFWTADGQNFAQFTPDIRFSPAKDVVLSVTRPEIVGRQVNFWMMLKYNIWYWQQYGDTRWYIDEAWLNSELNTRFNNETGLVSREIRHFSGWSVRTGDCEGEIPPPECDGGEGLLPLP
jgi:hypothetical protein